MAAWKVKALAIQFRPTTKWPTTEQPAGEKGGFAALRPHQERHPQGRASPGSAARGRGARKPVALTPPASERDGVGMAGDHGLWMFGTGGFCRVSVFPIQLLIAATAFACYRPPMNIIPLLLLAVSQPAPTPPVPLNESQRRDLSCVAVLAIIASEQERGVESAFDYPLLAERGATYAGLVGKRIMDETGRTKSRFARIFWRRWQRSKSWEKMLRIRMRWSGAK